MYESSCFFFQAEDGIRDADVTGVQTCALPILGRLATVNPVAADRLAVSGQPVCPAPGPQNLLFLPGLGGFRSATMGPSPAGLARTQSHTFDPGRFFLLDAGLFWQQTGS